MFENQAAGGLASGQPGQARRSINLGDDDGIVQITVAGVARELCPCEAINAINQKIASEDQRKGIPFLQIVQLFIADNFGVSVSADMADVFYRTLVKLERELSDFFAKRLDSLFTSDSTPGVSVEPECTATSPTSPGS